MDNNWALALWIFHLTLPVTSNIFPYLRLIRVSAHPPAHSAAMCFLFIAKRTSFAPRWNMHFVEPWILFLNHRTTRRHLHACVCVHTCVMPWLIDQMQVMYERVTKDTIFCRSLLIHATTWYVCFTRNAFHFLANWRLCLAYNALYLKFENANNVLLDQPQREKKNVSTVFAIFYSVLHCSASTRMAQNKCRLTCACTINISENFMWCPTWDFAVVSSDHY